MYFEYNLESDALNFCLIVSNGEGIPEAPDSITRSYCLPIKNQNKYYVIADAITSKYTTDTPVVMPPFPPPVI
jgi:hypothetical protein